jgi:hypothetical protein
VLQNEEIQLNPIIDANPVQFTMDTIGWKIVFVLLISAFAVMIYKYYQHYKKNAYRRVAISKIKELTMDNKSSMSFLISQIMFELKQTALQSYDRKAVAALEGEKWLQFLDKTIKKSTFTKHHDIIVCAIYKDEFKQNDSFNLNDFADMSINWIKNHA